MPPTFADHKNFQHNTSQSKQTARTCTVPTPCTHYRGFGQTLLANSRFVEPLKMLHSRGFGGACCKILKVSRCLMLILGSLYMLAIHYRILLYSP